MWFLIWVAFAIICAIIASNKNRSAVGWFILGLIFGIFALIVIACLSRLDVPMGADSRKCPHCAETILKAAKICKHCHQPTED